MVKSLQSITLGLLKAAGNILVDVGLSILLLGIGGLPVLSAGHLLPVYITPTGVLVGFISLIFITYLYIQVILG